jgi:hypothetical protein
MIHSEIETGMPFSPDAFDLTLLFLVAANLVGIAVYAFRIRLRTRRKKRDVAAIKATIVEYFRRSGVGVSVGCTSLGGSARFTAFVESEPMKRFRLSHIVEITLREHVRKTCNLELEKIYWRFPIKDASKGMAEDRAEADTDSDDYINEGLEHYRHVPQPEVTELPWEHFEEVATIDRENIERQKNTAAQEAQRSA